MLSQGDILALIADASESERFETLLELDGVRVERITSKGQVTPTGEWYDQPWHEWVLLMAGEALVQIDGETEAHRLVPGRWIMLPAHCRHRVEWTVPDQETIWLALHWSSAIQEE